MLLTRKKSPVKPVNAATYKMKNQTIFINKTVQLMTQSIEFRVKSFLSSVLSQLIQLVDTQKTKLKSYLRF